MIYFSFNEIISAAMANFVFGALFGIAQILAFLLLINVKSIIDILKRAYKREKSKHAISANNDIKYRAEFKNRQVIFALDFVFTLIFFIIFILISYVFSDGILRFYFLVISFLAYLCSYRFFKKKSLILGIFLYKVLNCILYPAFYLLFLPVRILYENLKKLSVKIYKPIHEKIKVKVSNKIFNEKIKDICNFFTKTPQM